MSFGVDPSKAQGAGTPGSGINFGVGAQSFNLGSNAPATTSATGTSLSGGNFKLILLTTVASIET